MAESITSLFNLALSSVGARTDISSPSEQSQEAATCQLWYPQVRKQVLAGAHWPSATKTKKLAVLVDRNTANTDWADGDPQPGFRFSYGLPSDYLRARFLTDYSRFVITDYDGNNKALATNKETALLTYTFDQTNPLQWDAELSSAIMFALAAYICMPLTGKAARAKTMIERSNALIMSAREGAANTNAVTYDVVPDFIKARGYTENLQPTQYVYQTGSLLDASYVG